MDFFMILIVGGAFFYGWTFWKQPETFKSINDWFKSWFVQ